MDFSLSKEHEAASRLAREFAVGEVAPIIQEWDRRHDMAPQILPRMGELGFLGVCLPARYGGQGMDYITLGLVCEELEAVDSTLRVVLSVHVGLNSMGLLQWGSEEQKQRFLTPQARGEKIAGFALTEPGAGSDVAAIASRAERDGDEYILYGEKTWISLASKADHLLWFARTDPTTSDPHDGLTAFILETDRPGVTRGDHKGKLGMRAGSTGWIHCEGVRVPADRRLGQEGEGFVIAMSCLDNGRYTVAAGATGLLRAARDASVRYAGERRAFGRPLAGLQLIQSKIADMTRDYEAARLLYLHAGWLKNQGRRNTRETSLAKWFATDTSFAAAAEAVQVHGAYGYSDEFPVERYLRNAKGAMIYEGSSEIHRLIQAGYALGLRRDTPLRCELPAYDADAWLAPA